MKRKSTQNHWLITARLLLAVIAILFTSQRANATHAAGADFTYKCLGGLQYELTISFYRDCGGVAEPATISVNYKSVIGGHNLNATASKIASTGQEITLPCSTATTSCSGGATTGLRQFVYKTTITLPSARPDWVFSYSVCCRNCAITTITNPCGSSSNLYVEATLNNFLAPCNSSPIFSNIPIAFVCIGQGFNYNHGVLDPDGDSLVYSLITPRTAATTNVSYIAPHNTNNPIITGSGFNINSVTGDLIFTPSQIEIGILTVLVKEYRNGQLIGSVIRDMQIYTQNCPNNLPTASGINGTTNFSINVCPNQQICFTVNTIDTDALQTVTISTNNGITGATYTIGSGTRPTLTFCWTPTNADIGSLPNTFTVTVTDNACPTKGVQTFSYTIYVPGPNYIINTTNVACYGASTGTASASPVKGNTYSYVWSNGATTQNITGLAAGTYTVTATDSVNCAVTQTITITQPAAIASSAVVTNASCSTVCNGSVDVNVTGGTSTVTYLWSNGRTTQDVTALCTGNYTVTITEGNGCTRTISNTIAFNYTMNATASVTNINCYGNASGNMSFSPSGGTAPYTYSWSTGATVQNLTSALAGSYTATATDANGCKANATATVTQPAAAITSSLTKTNVACFGNSTGTVTLTVNGGTPTYTYNWSNGATTQNVTSLAAGTYTVTATDSKGCTSSSTTTITQPSVLSSSVSSQTNVKCFGNNTGAINLSVNGGTTAYTYNWSNGNTTQNISGLVSGNYTCTITDANNCSTTATANITQPTASLSATVSSQTDVKCFGNNTGAINLSVSGGTTAYTYNWSNGNTTQNISGLVSGNYTVTITDANNCTTTVTATITQPVASLLSSVASQTNVKCFGNNTGAINLSVSGGTTTYTYNWSNGNTTQNISGLVSGNYTCTITDANNCTTTSTSSITQPVATLSASVSSQTNVKCFGNNTGAINLNVSGGTTVYTYNWSNGSITQNISALVSGNYTCTISDANNCTTTATASITQPTATLAASVASQTNVKCFGNNTGAVNLSVSGGTTAYSYNWSNAATTQNISGLVSGNYTVTVTDANNCTITATTSITQPTATLSASISSQTNVKCFGNNTGAINLSVSGGTTAYSYNWSNAATTQNISGLVSGNYTCTITDANNCTTTANVTITQPVATLSASVSSQTSVKCFGNNTGAINLSVNGGTTAYTYNWSNAATTQSISGLVSGNYTCTITDANNCTTTATASITQPTATLNASVSSQTNVKCFGNNTGVINLSVSGGTTAYSYNWSNGSTTQNISGLVSGNYTCTITDANNCTTTATASITQPTVTLSATISSQINVKCFGNNTGTATASPTGGTSPYTYLWSNGISTAANNNLTSGTYTCTITDANNCTTILTTNITQPLATLSASISSQTNVKCYGNATGSATATPNGGTSPYTYSWSNGTTTAANINLASGTYTCTVTDANNCTTSLTATITQPSATLSASVSSQTNVKCFGNNTGAINLTVNGGTAGYSYLWSNGANSQNISNLNSGNYTVTVTDANNCTTTVTATITQPVSSLLSSVASQTNVNCFGNNTGAINLTVNGGTTAYTYNWSNGSTTQNISTLASGSYAVTITDANNCTTSSSATITQPTVALALSTTKTNVRCFGNNTGVVNLSVSGGTTAYTYSWSNAATTQNIANLIAGTYTVTVTDANNCTATIATTITQPAAALTIASTKTDVKCFGNTTGAINLTVTGGTTSYNYLWSNGAGSQNITNLTSGNYTVTVTDANNCTATSTIAIAQPIATLTVTTASKTDVKCFGNATGSATMNITGGTTPYTYSWSNGATTQNISNLTAGTYTVTVRDVNLCSTTATVIITQPIATLTSSTIVINVNCRNGNDGFAILNVHGGTTPYTYNWSNGATAQNIIGVIAGTYSVTITDINLCTATSNVTITQPAATLSATNTHTDISCIGNAVGGIDLTVNGGTTPYTYTWSNGSSSQDITNLSAAAYSVTVTDNNGCTATSLATVTQPAGALSVTNSIISVKCFGNASGDIDLTASAGTPPYSYQWNNGSTTADLHNLSSGTYTVTVTDANGCALTNTLFVTQPLASLQLTTNAAINVSCFGDNTGVIDLQTLGGTSPYFYLWNNGTTAEDLLNIPSGNYSVVVTDANNCTTTTALTIQQPTAALAMTANTSNLPCHDLVNGAIDVTASGGTVPYSYQWNTGNLEEDLTNLSTGNYSVTVTDAQGCTVANNYVLSYSAATLNATANLKQINCHGDATGNIDLNVNGGTTPFTYSWSNGTSGEDLNNITTGTYSVTITDASGCTTTNTFTLNEPPASLQGTNTAVNQLCFGDSTGWIDLTLTGGTSPYNITWNNGENSEDINQLPKGNYNVNVIDANGCPWNQSITINGPAAALNASFTPTNLSCNGDNTGSIQTSINGGTTPYIVTWNNVTTTVDLNNLSAGDYTVMITDSNNCPFTQTISIAEPATLTNAISQQINIDCFSNSIGTIQVAASGGTTPYTYAWSNGETSSSVTNLVAGNYSYTITDSHNCITNGSTTITQPANALNVTNAITSINCHGDATGTIDLNVNGGTPGYNFNWSNGATTEDISSLANGTYTVTVADNNGCVYTNSFVVNEPNASLAVNASSTTNIGCFGMSTGAIGLSTNGGTAPYNYSWSNGATTDSINAINAGTYSVLVTDNNGCTQSGSWILSEPTATLTSSISQQINIDCFSNSSGSIQLSVNGGTTPYSYLWSNGETTFSISNLAAGNYSYTIIDANNCVTNGSTTITTPANYLNVTNTVTTINCHGDATGIIDLNVSGGTPGYNYNWSNGATTEDVQSLTNGTYTVTVTDNNGCIYSNSFSVNQPTATLAVSASSITNIGCFGMSTGAIGLVVNGGTAPYNYSWNTGATTDSIHTITAGTYSVLVTDNNGCTQSGSWTLLEPAATLTTTVATTPVQCFGNTTGTIDVTIYGGTAPYYYSWSNGATVEDLSNITSGTYSLTITDAHNCTTSATATIAQPNATLSNTFFVTDVKCFGDETGVVQSQIVGGTAPYIYQWNNGSTTSSINNLSSGIYAVTITDANGCMWNDSASVVQPNAALAATIAAHNINCFGNSGWMDLTVNGGMGGYTYQWNNGGTTQDPQNISAGNYTVVITDNNQCTTTASASITQPNSALTVTASTNNVSCNGANNGSIILTINGGSPSYSILWNNGFTGDSLMNIQGGNYSVVITDANGCTSTYTTTIVEPQNVLQATLSATNANCLLSQTGSVTLTVNGGTEPYIYHWSNGASTQNLNNVFAGAYTVTITDANGCTQHRIAYVTDQSALTINTNGGPTICVGNTVTLSATNLPDVQFQWYFNGIVINGAVNNTFITPAAGTYTLVATTSCGAYTSNPIDVVVRALENVSVSNNYIICPGESVQLIAGGGVDYVWSPTQGLSDATISNPTASPTTTTSYTVTVRDGYGCSATASVQVAVMCDTLDVPNGFSPNNDGTNDYFVIDGISHYPGNSLFVYNRWGNLVYKKSDYDNKWDGTSNVSGIYMSRELPNGTYFFLLDLNNNTKPINNYVVLRR